MAIAPKTGRPLVAPESTPRPHLRDDGIPTRCDRDLMSYAEIAISDAMAAVEDAGASVALTDAVVLLSKARDRVADHVEGRFPSPLSEGK